MNRQEFKKVVHERFLSLADNHPQKSLPIASCTIEIQKTILRSFGSGFINLNLVENELQTYPIDDCDYLLGDEMPFSANKHDYSKDKLVKYLTTVFEEVTPKDWHIKCEFRYGALFIKLDNTPDGYTLDTFPHDVVQFEIDKKLRQTGQKKMGVVFDWGMPLWHARLIVNKNTGQCWCFDTYEKSRAFFHENVVSLMLEKIKQMFPEFIANQQINPSCGF